jgi:hypothetical protein
MGGFVVAAAARDGDAEDAGEGLAVGEGDAAAFVTVMVVPFTIGNAASV